MPESSILETSKKFEALIPTRITLSFVSSRRTESIDMFSIKVLECGGVFLDCYGYRCSCNVRLEGRADSNKISLVTFFIF